MSLTRLFSKTPMRLLVHTLTAAGAALAFFALIAAQEHHFAASFAWLLAALIIDGLDGALARLCHCSAPDDPLDGALLDLIVDYLTYVLVPVDILIAAGLILPPLGLPLAGIILISAALYFARRRMKTAAGDGFYGFPALWNMAVFYLLTARLPQDANSAIVVVLAILQFVPIIVIHPLRERRARLPTLLVSLAYMAVALKILWQDFQASPSDTLVLALVPLYYVWPTLAMVWGKKHARD